MKKLKFLIVYGPTQEPIDPVRYLSNYSTGTMGRCLVEAAKSRNHLVTAVECPKDVQTARELLETLKKLISRADILIMAAAVCDMRPKTLSSKKIKKENLNKIELIKNPDILAELSKLKKKAQVFVGFALESSNVLKNSVNKLKKKSLDWIVAQEVGAKTKPFGDSKVCYWIINSDAKIEKTTALTKESLARILIARCEGIL